MKTLATTLLYMSVGSLAAAVEKTRTEADRLAKRGEVEVKEAKATVEEAMQLKNRNFLFY